MNSIQPALLMNIDEYPAQSLISLNGLIFECVMLSIQQHKEDSNLNRTFSLDKSLELELSMNGLIQ